MSHSKTEVMKLHDYIPFYVGATLHYGSGRFIIKGFHFTKSHADKLTVFVIDEDGDEDSLPIDENSRIELRALSDMTEEEFLEIFKPIQPNDVSDEQLMGAINNLKADGFACLDFGDMDAIAVFEIFRKLLSKHFDLFNLIENNLAIDKTTLK